MSKILLLFVITLILRLSFTFESVQPLIKFDSLIEDHKNVIVKNIIALPKIMPRIFNGSEVTIANQSKFKFQVKLVTHKPKNKMFGCGGTIISKRLVLTASHCLENGINSTIYFGIIDQYERLHSQQQTVFPNNWKMHENYNTTTVQNDIALILLPNEIKYSEFIGEIALPEKTSCNNFAKQHATISGWGVLNDKNSPPVFLQYSYIIIDESQVCEKFFSEISFDVFRKETMLCINAAKSATCEGDSGGPLTMMIDNKLPTLIGITSFTVNNCEHNFNRVDTCVSAYIDWIKLNAGDLWK